MSGGGNGEVDWGFVAATICLAAALLICVYIMLTLTGFRERPTIRDVSQQPRQTEGQR